MTIGLSLHIMAQENPHDLGASFICLPTEKKWFTGCHLHILIVLDLIELKPLFKMGSLHPNFILSDDIIDKLGPDRQRVT